MEGRPFDQVVAGDVQRDPEEPQLGHPLLLDRWEAALQRLAQHTADRLGLSLRSAVAVTNIDLAIVGLDAEDAYLRINQLRFMVHIRQRWLERLIRARRLRRQVGDWRDQRLAPVRAAACEQMRRRYPDEYRQLLEDAMAEDAMAEDVATGSFSRPAEPATTPTRQTPQSATMFLDQVRQLGWQAELVPLTNDDRHIRVEARRERSASLRVAYQRKKKGRGAGWGWRLKYVGVWLPADGWTQLPTIADATELAALDEPEFSACVARYRNAYQD